MQPDGSGMGCSPVSIAILVFPETSGSVVYGLYDLFRSAGRDWGVVTEGYPGDELIHPLLVARETGPIDVSNNVAVTPHATLEQCPAVEIVCVPEVNLPPRESLAGRYQDEMACCDNATDKHGPTGCNGWAGLPRSP